MEDEAFLVHLQVCVNSSLQNQVASWALAWLSCSINKMASVVTNVNLSDILTELDIPGALLPQEAPELCNVVQLKRWLTCRGACTTGRKREVELVSRLVEVWMAS